MADKDVDLLQKLIAQKQQVDADLSKSIKAGSLADTAKYAQLARNIENAEAIQKEYNEALSKYEKLVADGKEGTEELTKAQQRLVETTENRLNAERALVKTAQDSIAATKKQAAETKELWQNTTLLGKIHKGLTSSLLSYAKGLTFAALSAKALGRVEEAAQLRQTLLIKGYRDLSVESQKGYVAAAKSVMEYEAALRSAQATAARFGVDTSEVSVTMEKFSRIVGSDNPKALGTLTETSIGVAKELGIDVAEATDYVAQRMDKFGGSATGAIVTLHNLRKETAQVNDLFGTTVLRADDVSRTLIEIGRNESIYAMDQRAISNVLRDNIARLESMGESYDQAYKKAKLFTEGLTEKAPTWMKILSGQDIMGSVNKGLQEAAKKGIDFSATELGKALEKAKPGLAKRVSDIYKDPSISYYDKTRAIQELTAGSKVGLSAMNKQIAKLGKQYSVIAQQFGVTYDQAIAMSDAAKDQLDTEKAISDTKKQLATLTGTALDKRLKELGLSRAEYEQDLKDHKLSEDGKNLNDEVVETLVRQQKLREEGIKYKTADGKLTDEQRKKAIQGYKDEIKAIEEKEEAAKKAGDTGQQAVLEAQKSELEVKLADTLGKVDEQQLDVLKDILGELKKNVPATPGGIAKSLVTSISGPMQLMGAAVVSGLVSHFLPKLLMGGLGNLLGGSGGGGILGAAMRGGGALLRGAGTLVRGGGALLGEGVEGAGTLLAGGGAAATTAGIATAGAVGYEVGKHVVKPLDDALDKWTGGYSIGSGFEKLFEMGGKLVGGPTVMSDEEAMAKGAEMVKARRAQMPKPTAAAAGQQAATTGGTPPGQTTPPTPAGAAAAANAATAAAGAPNAVEGQVGALQPDGSVMVKLVNFMDAVGQGLVFAKKAIPAGPHK